MRSRKIVAAAVAACGLVAMSAGSAQASKPSTSYQSPVVEWVAPVVHALSDGTAVVHGKYKCSGGTEGSHLYIGVKQGPQIDADTHTSSEFADTFYSTNWGSDQGALALNCDGYSHNSTFVLQPDPYWAKAGDNPPALHAGVAFVQFCVFDSTGSEETGFAFDYSMRKVVQN